MRIFQTMNRFGDAHEHTVLGSTLSRLNVLLDNEVFWEKVAAVELLTVLFFMLGIFIVTIVKAVI